MIDQETINRMGLSERQVYLLRQPTLTRLEFADLMAVNRKTGANIIHRHNLPEIDNPVDNRSHLVDMDRARPQVLELLRVRRPARYTHRGDTDATDFRQKRGALAS